MERSEQIDQLATALSAVQSVVEDAAKSRQNPAFRSNYATLGDIWDACREELTKNGLSIIQIPQSAEEGFVALTTVLLHKSGQYIAGTVSAPLAKKDPQGVGSALTYLRRYGVAAFVGICPADDDANKASGQRAETVQRTTPPAAAKAEAAPEKPKVLDTDPATEEQLERIRSVASKAGVEAIVKEKMTFGEAKAEYLRLKALQHERETTKATA